MKELFPFKINCVLRILEEGNECKLEMEDAQSIF